MRKQWYVIGRGFSGWHATGIAVRSSAGSCNEYAKEAFEGALVYDAMHLHDNETLRNAFVDLIIKGPMCDPALPPEGVKRWIKGERGHIYRALDCVGVRVYDRLLRSIPGIKMGYVRKGEVMWE